ncbi:pyridoxal phosphate-dependent aminotransferase [Alkalibacter saccharofermentans]|uniref:L-threonine O-3-phosphate decarboxylase n=1 Tax=Alkalibacter saccharofermentans DSM 14828 TaxID=1120975 RepID=A0A1M4SI51_9FIRM|nr:histidinol-phosphate transaminase [Alkalibacter saccharofermentans]SHE31667.1 L-threonine O-3-phosphate decarboxylase [Alkalibacter saccharofermentans DSM 14828]
MTTKSFCHGGDVWQGENPSDWIDFSANLNPRGAPDRMLREIKKSINEIGFYPDQKMREAKENIADFLGCDISKVLPTNGGIGALQLVVEHERPTKAIIIEPSFAEYKRLALKSGADIVHIPMFQKDEIIWDVDRIKKEIVNKGMIFICSPSNPLGNIVERRILLEILECSEKSGAVVVLDEAFIDYCEENSARDLIDKYSSLVIMGSFTKMFSIPGVRLGYALACENMIKTYEKYMMPWSLSAQAVGASRALPSLKAFANESAGMNRLLRKKLSSDISRLGFTVFDSEANYLLVKINDEAVSLDYIEMKLKEKNVLIRNCSNYECLGDRYFRVGVKSEKENSMLVEYLETILSKPTWRTT